MLGRALASLTASGILAITAQAQAILYAFDGDATVKQSYARAAGEDGRRWTGPEDPDRRRDDSLRALTRR